MAMNMTEFAKKYGTQGPKLVVGRIISELRAKQDDLHLEIAVEMIDDLTEALEEFVQ